MSTDTRSSTDYYVRDIHRYPLLSEAEFDRLIRRAHAGDREATNKIVQGNLRFVIQIASEYNTPHMAFADLVSEGNIGLIKAVEKFNPDLGYKFSTYAVWWIRNAIQRTLRWHRNPLRLPLNRQDDLDKLYKSAEHLSQKLGRQVSPEEAADYLNMTTRRSTAAIEMQKLPISLDTAFCDEMQDGFLHEQIPDDKDRPDEALENSETSERLKRAVKHLDRRDAQIIELTFGFSGDPVSLTEVAQRLSISKERVRQIRNRALHRLRQQLDQDDAMLLAVSN